jgi:glycosyltransferase involved in cell wall biosynthesis
LLLTFAIPVFNDAAALRLTLSSVLAASDVKPDTVEIIVSDNHSEDDSFQVAQMLLSGIADTKALRQATNLGFAGNLRILSELATGRYIWFLGAGDTLMPGQLKHIINALQETKPDFGVVTGMFEYQQKWRNLPNLRSFTISDARSFSTTALFSHAVSLNIISRKVMDHYWESTASKETFSGGGEGDNIEGNLEGPKSAVREIHWPHLEAVCQTIIDNESASIKWMEYDGLSVLLGKNKNGDWDKRPSALEVFRQWAEIVRLCHRSLPKSRWLSEMNTKLHGSHLLQFLFMLRKDETIARTAILKQILSMPIGPGIKIASATVTMLPKAVVGLLVYGRGFFLKILGLVSDKTQIPKSD